MAFALSSPLVPSLADVPADLIFAMLGVVAGGLVHVAFDQFITINVSYTSYASPPKGYYPGLRTLLQLGAWFAITAMLSFSPLPFMTSFGLTMFALMGIIMSWSFLISLTKKGDGIGLSADANNFFGYIYAKLFGQYGVK